MLRKVACIGFVVLLAGASLWAWTVQLNRENIWIGLGNMDPTVAEPNASMQTSAQWPTLDVGDQALLDETLHLLHSSNRPSVMLKLDFEKVFDNINWEFLIDSLKGFGFGEKWITWIKMCIYLAKFSILVKGSLEAFLEPQMD